VCSGCAEFYAQSREMMDVLAAVDLTVSARQWNPIDQRLRASILNVHTSRAGVRATTDTRRALRRYMSASVFAACAALLIITIGLSRIGVPKNPRAAAQIPTVVYIEHSVPLDPGTVDFLEESELLLRNVMKIRPADVEDLAEAKKNRQRAPCRAGTA